MSEGLKKWIKTLIGFGVSILFVYFFISTFDISEIISLILKSELSLLLAAAVSLIVGYSIRVYRWQYMLTEVTVDAGYVDSASVFMKSIALNNLLPFRMGDVFRMLAFKSIADSKAKVPASVLFERVLDLLSLVFMLGAIGLFVDFEIATLNILGLLVALVVVLLVLLPLWLTVLHHIKTLIAGSKFAQHRLLNTIIDLAEKFLKTVAVYLKAKLFTKLLLLSLMCWVFEAGTFLFVCKSLGLALEWPVILALTCVATLSTLIPSAPGYIGTFHFVVGSFLANLSIPDSESGAVAVLVHFMLWGVTTAIGSAFFLMSKQSQPAQTNGVM